MKSNLSSQMKAESSVRTNTSLLLCIFILIEYVFYSSIFLPLNRLYKLKSLLLDSIGRSDGLSCLFRGNFHVIDSVNYSAFPVREHRESFHLPELNNNKYFILCTEN